jgi:hypothetical protein
MASTKSSTTRSTTTTSAPAQKQQQQSRRGNLGSVLMSYDHSFRGGGEDEQTRQSMGHRLAIDLPEKHVNAIDDGLDDDDDDDDDEDHGEQDHGGGNCNDDNDRVRSLTLGSEFDLAWITGGMKEGRGMSIGSGTGRFTPLGECNNNMTTTTSNESTATWTAMATAMTDDPTVVSSDVSASEPSTSDARRIRTTGAQRWQPQQQQQQHMPARSRGDSTASASHFLNGLFHNHQLQQQPPSQARAHGQHVMTAVAHTPPTQMGNSYENSHFGKRMRAGVSNNPFFLLSDIYFTGLLYPPRCAFSPKRTRL